jgi:hypothetical protein
LTDPLYSDSDLASILRMSRSWIRKQRMLRRAGQPHVLTIDPIMIGSCPRYWPVDIKAWLEAQRALPAHTPTRGRPDLADGTKALAGVTTSPAAPDSTDIPGHLN